MTTTQASEYDRLLLDGTDRLVAEFSGEFTAGRIIAAVARTRMSVRNSFDRLGLEPHPPDELTALVVGLARQALLTQRKGPRDE
jgi:hypothetical protein